MMRTKSQLSKWFFCLLLCTGLIGWCIPTQAAIYKWVDKEGNVHFGDQSHDESEKITVNPNDTYRPTPADQGQDDFVDEPAKATPFKYELFALIEPPNEATIRRTDDKVEVSFEVEPELRGGDQIVVFLDDTATGEPSRQLNVVIDQVYRGAHKIVANIIDKKGKVVATSNAVTIYMHKPRVGIKH